MAHRKRKIPFRRKIKRVRQAVWHGLKQAFAIVFCVCLSLTIGMVAIDIVWERQTSEEERGKMHSLTNEEDVSSEWADSMRPETDELSNMSDTDSSLNTIIDGELMMESAPETLYDTSYASQIISKYRSNAIVSAGADNSAWIAEGRVAVIGKNDSGQNETEAWQDVVAIAMGDNHIVGLTSEGKLLFAGDNSYEQCSLDVGDNRVVSIAASARASFAVLEDGSVRMSGSSIVNDVELKDEQNIAVVAASDSHIVLLKKDGSVVAFGENAHGECDTAALKKIEMVDCGYNVTLALDADGVVHVLGDTVYGQNQLDKTQNVKSISAGGNFCLVVLNDGTVLGAGSNSKGQTDVMNWENMRTVACGYMHAIGVAENGVRIYSGSDYHGQTEQE